MNKVGKKGFTLVEVLAAIAIIGILATLIVTNVLKDVNDGKDNYNDKLKSQLTLSAKTYYTEHREELPKLANNRAYSYVTVPEMQSNNYITNEFVDSNGNECSPSYVYVREKGYNTNNYEYIPCLVCQDEKGNKYDYNEDNLYCKITNWSDTNAPTCTPDNTVTNYDDRTSWNLKAPFDEEGLLAVIIRNKKTGDYKAIDVSKSSQSDIEGINIKEEFKNKFDNSKNGDYEVVLLDIGGNESESCMDFEISQNECSAYRDGDNVIIRSAISTKELKALYYKAGSTDTFVKEITGKEITNETIYNVPQGATLYLVNTKDEKIPCSIDPEPASPQCEFIQTPGKDYVGKSGTTLKAQCKLCTGKSCTNLRIREKSNIASNITVGGKGTISNVTYSPSSGEGATIEFTMKYTPNDKQGGQDYITIRQGVVENPKDTNKVNNEVTTFVNVDTIPPEITYGGPVGTTGNATAKNDNGFGYQNSVSNKVTCTDKHSGVKTLKVNNSNVTNPYTVVFNARGTFSITSKCEDYAGNTDSKNAGPYRVLIFEPDDCNKCGVKEYNTCTSYVCGCE